MEQELVNEVLTSIGGGAAVSTIAWSLLYVVWRKLEGANADKFNMLNNRADKCEEDRNHLRKKLDDLNEEFHSYERDNMRDAVKVMEENTVEIRKLIETQKVNT